MSTDNSAPGYRVTAGVRTPMWRIGPAHPDHPEYVRTDTLNRADQARTECDCAPSHTIEHAWVVVDTDTGTLHDRWIHVSRDVANRVAASRVGLTVAAVAWASP